MIRNPEKVRAFEEALARSEPPDFERSLRLVEGMYQLARTLGAFPLDDSLEGIELDIRIAKVVNVRSPS